MRKSFILFLLFCTTVFFAYYVYSDIKLSIRSDILEYRAIISENLNEEVLNKGSAPHVQSANDVDNVEKDNQEKLKNE